MLRKVPLIVILGSTGTGKTKLSLELAERFGGEIISADSMQVYANLDIATAKATKEEQSRAKHHLLDVATPAEPFTVVDFRNKALPIIENLLSQSKCPIVVGGTNYYIESLLWDILVSPTAGEDVSSKSPSPQKVAAAANDASALKDNGSTSTSVAAAATNAETVALKSGNLQNTPFIDPAEYSILSSVLLHNHLKMIDPETANRIHPNNKRKIMRAIDYYQETGQTLSSKLKEQREQPGGNRLGGPLRYAHTILFWLRCNQDILNTRLDKRVDAMLEQGLLREIRAFHNEHNVDKSAEYTKGVLQTIGYKEFVPYLEKFNATNDEKIEEYLRLNSYKMPSEEHFKQYAGSICEPSSEAAPNTDTIDPKERLPPGLDVLNSCLNELKLVTRRYSKKQQKWINNRFLASRDRQVPDIYELDTSDVSRWHECVYSPAVTVIDCYRSSQVCEIQPMPKRTHPGADLNEETTNFCETCQRHFIGEYQWHLHLKSNRHKKRKEALRKKQAEQPPQVDN
ncbi:tRNA dimethylallyltransferase [Musca domestica]|uniref:tRNA dimethylallyltransferase n=3 Tax=Musca domestica TaxID=7370 RepID=A0ABM3UTQ6_MUSDO|nr:tRNA dimethylallyltransferase [Musca domestica]